MIFSTNKYIGLFILALLVFGCAQKSNNSNTFQSHFYINGSTDTLTQNEINSLQNGDIILRHGRGALSLAISAQLAEEYPLSHCGIVQKNGDSVFVIHSLSAAVSPEDGVQRATLAYWLADTYKNSVVVVRLRSAYNDKVLRKAQYYLTRKVPFDDDFDSSDSTKLYCSELVMRILADECDLNLFDSVSPKDEALRFAKFLDSRYFDVIVNHQAK